IAPIIRGWRISRPTCAATAGHLEADRLHPASASAHGTPASSSQRGLGRAPVSTAQILFLALATFAASAAERADVALISNSHSASSGLKQQKFSKQSPASRGLSGN